MAVGADAASAGYALVPNTGEEGLVRHGAREINRTRDFIALVKAMIPDVQPLNKGGTGSKTKGGARANLGITSGTASPTGGSDGDIYFKIST